MGLRISGGTARGREILARKGPDTRPTSAKSRSGLFDILRPRMAGSRWLDLYAGNGTIGLEALSRGADYVVFAERHRDACRMITTNVAKLGFGEQTFLWCGEVLKLLSQYQAEPFDIAFFDPPWGTDNYRDTLRWLTERNLVRPDGLIIAEHRKEDLPQAVVGDWQRIRTADYGDTHSSFYPIQGDHTAVPDDEAEPQDGEAEPEQD
ncbi:MAG: 16S rRNA (guanine(966)-N(2))-methyltransferase RsmD [Candidatus Sericytochromatia bacterium]|nr:16S rRNA (guanine(966)-N(2))-methyltransferase RsmD [Candidatus Sericytochromatia bacterium]